MSRIALAVVVMTFVMGAGLGSASATQQFSTFLFAADSASQASDAARQAASQTGGRVLDVKKYQRGDTLVFDVKVLLDDGRVKVIQLEGKPGAGQNPSDE